MKKYRITITDNETGETLLDTDTNAAIGAVADDNGASVFCRTACDKIEFSGTLAVLQALIDRMLRENPEIKKLFLEMLETVSKEMHT